MKFIQTRFKTFPLAAVEFFTLIGISLNLLFRINYSGEARNVYDCVWLRRKNIGLCFSRLFECDDTVHNHSVFGFELFSVPIYRHEERCILFALYNVVFHTLVFSFSALFWAELEKRFIPFFLGRYLTGGIRLDIYLHSVLNWLVLPIWC